MSVEVERKFECNADTFKALEKIGGKHIFPITINVSGYIFFNHLYFSAQQCVLLKVSLRTSILTVLTLT